MPLNFNEFFERKKQELETTRRRLDMELSHEKRILRENRDMELRRYTEESKRRLLFQHRENIRIAINALKKQLEQETLSKIQMVHNQELTLKQHRALETFIGSLVDREYNRGL